MEVQPVVAASGTVTFVNGGAAVAIDSGATVSDADGYNLASATVSPSGFQTGDVLAFDGGPTPETFTDGDTISGSFSAGTLTLTGVATAANYQAALDSVTFSTNSTGATARIIDWTVSDGVVSSATDTSTVDVHVPPTIAAGATATFDGGGSAVVLDLNISLTAFTSTLASATVSFVSPLTGDTLNFTNTSSSTEGNIAVSSDANGRLVLSSSGDTATRFSGRMRSTR